MSIVFTIFLILHILSGTVGLLTGAVNIFREKGNTSHVLYGRVFFISMLMAGFSALVLSIMHPNYFLFTVGVFTIYMVGSGQRYMYRNRHHRSSPYYIEWSLSSLMLIAGIVFIGIGILDLAKSNLFGLVFLTFAFFGLLFVLQDFQNYKGKSKIANFRTVAHLQRMIGAFIAASTAFLVVNAQYFPSQIPGFIYWLLPTITLTPLIVKWSRRYAGAPH